MEFEMAQQFHRVALEDMLMLVVIMRRVCAQDMPSFMTVWAKMW